MVYMGSFYSGKVRFEDEVRPDGAMECTRSICGKAGFLHWIVERDQVRILAGQDKLAADV